MRKLLFTLLMIWAAVLTSAQQIPQLTQWNRNTMFYNPAFSGSIVNPEIRLHNRTQWIGFSGAPITNLLSFNSEIITNMGIGALIMNDISGPAIHTTIKACYAYHLTLPGFFWSFGLSITGRHYRLNSIQFEYHDTNDQILTNTEADSKISPDAGFGTYLYNKKFFIGFSANNLLVQKLEFFNQTMENASIQMRRHYYLMGGTTILINRRLEMEPSAMVGFVSSSPGLYIGNLEFTYNKKLVMGITYRYGADAAIIIGYSFGHFNFNYSCGIATSRLITTNSGSHELYLCYTIPTRIKSRPMYDLKGTYRGQIEKRVH